MTNGSLLDQARAGERELRHRLAAAITQRLLALDDAARLDVRAALPGADPRVAAAATAQRARAERLGDEIERLRAQLRAQEGRVAELEAAVDDAT